MWDEEEVAKFQEQKGTWTRSEQLDSFHLKSQAEWTHSEKSSVRNKITSTDEKYICYLKKKKKIQLYESDEKIRICWQDNKVCLPQTDPLN